MTKSGSAAVVASLAERSPHPFSSLALSPSRQYAVIAGKDTLQLIKIDPTGIKSLRSIKVSQHFQGSVPPSDPRSQVGKKAYGDVRDTFNLGVKQSPHAHARNNMTHGNVVITGVAWSPKLGTEPADTTATTTPTLDSQASDDDDSLVAAAGSNGVIVIWDAKKIFFSERSGKSANLANQQPEAILSQGHSRAVHSLAWHPKNAAILLTGSQDSTVKLWKRTEVAPRKDKDRDPKRLFGFFMAPPENQKEYTWKCKSTFEPKSEAVREIQWSRFQDDIFALVTVSGSLVIYSMHVAFKSIAKIAAHAGDATTLDWHPTRPFVIATGGSADRCVKVWNVESCVNMKHGDGVFSGNSNTWGTTKSDMSNTSGSSSETDKSREPSPPTSFMVLNQASGRTMSTLSGQRYKSTNSMTMHVMSISSSVTKVQWRPPALTSTVDDNVDRHDSMLAVATARLTSAGGSGVISLWSTHRAFMPLSVVEGHQEGAVADFVWMQTPQENPRAQLGARLKKSDSNTSNKGDSRRLRRAGTPPTDETIVIRSGGRGDTESILFDNYDNEAEGAEPSKSLAIWQHVLSIGRDGQCILQSFTRGDRPISQVPSSCFAMANFSPYQSGYGSLQIFSVYQQVPNDAQNDLTLTGLRQDECTAEAPGVFKEVPVESEDLPPTGVSIPGGKRLPDKTPELVFNVVDQGPLDGNNVPIPAEDDIVCVAPEVVHLSRFASSYKLYPESSLPTRVDLCLHNGEVAETLRSFPLARMWRSVAGMLSGSGLDELPPKDTAMQPTNVMHFAIIPTIKSLLLERADAGDVQSCVALCEVLQVVEETEDVRVPGLPLNQVREWYLTYIDLLQQMCLFSSATFLIKSSKDPFIRALNQQSTTIYESCPRCGKPLQPAAETSDKSLNTAARRACLSCRRRIGLCFICHEPVKGMFVWCPGCGHGGHLEHALQWFGGQNRGTAREVCPTGCGHRCNFVQTLSAFPRTDSLMCLPAQDA